MDGNPIVTVTQTDLPTVLGRGQVRLPVGGKIRAGIKVLTKAAAAQPEAVRIYEEGMSQDLSFDDIERRLAQALPALKHPLVPRNVAWFTVRGGDFANPVLATQIMALYGEDRGEGRHLYRIPVVFPADQWQTVMPHDLVAWGAGERRYWSEYSADGSTRYCMRHVPIPVDTQGRRTIRIFGGRKQARREENGGLCDPETCAEYQNRQCNLSGRFLFFIPGIKSLSAIELPTNSFYAMERAIQTFRTIAFLRGGRISGFLDEQRTPFFLSKRLLEVPHIDESGRPVRVRQWIIELEAPVDVTALLRAQDDDTLLSRAAQAIDVLQGASAGGDAPCPPALVPAMDADRDAFAGMGTVAPQEEGAAAVSTGRHDGPTLDAIVGAAEALGVSRDDFLCYAAKRLGEGWRLNAGGRQRALDELQRYADDAVAFARLVEAAISPIACPYRRHRP